MRVHINIGGGLQLAIACARFGGVVCLCVFIGKTAAVAEFRNRQSHGFCQQSKRTMRNDDNDKDDVGAGRKCANSALILIQNCGMPTRLTKFCFIGQSGE